MKKRVIFCLFLSLYLFYTQSEKVLPKLNELPYFSALIRFIIELFANLKINTLNMPESDLLYIHKESKYL